MIFCKENLKYKRKIMASTAVSVPDSKNCKVDRIILNALFDSEIIKYIPDDIIDNIYIIDFKHSFIRDDYICNIGDKDVEYPLSFGIDKESRPFLAIKYKYNGIDVVETIFQRYSSNLNVWALGTRYYGVMKRSLQGYSHIISHSEFFGKETKVHTLYLLKKICENGFKYDTTTKK